MTRKGYRERRRPHKGLGRNTRRIDYRRGEPVFNLDENWKEECLQAKPMTPIADLHAEQVATMLELYNIELKLLDEKAGCPKDMLLARSAWIAARLAQAEHGEENPDGRS